MTVVYEGIEYYDDRLLVVHASPCILERESNEHFKTIVYYEQLPKGADAGWCVVVRQNSGNYRVVDIFNVPTEPFAAELKASIEALVPLASLGGEAPASMSNLEPRQTPHPPFDYNKLFMDGGENAREMFMQSKEQFFSGARKVMDIMKLREPR